MPTTWNPADKHASVTLSGGNLTAVGSPSTAGGVRGTEAIGSGKAYFEITHTSTATVDDYMGVATASKVINQTSGVNAVVVDAWGGNVFVNSTSNTANIGDFASGDVLCVALDLDNKRAWLRRNAGNWNGSGAANPATNVGGLDVSALFTGVSAYPWVCFVDTGKTNILNAGASAFAQVAPAGFSTWNSFGAPVEPPASAGSSYGYVGNASGASRGRMIRKRKKGEQDDIDLDELLGVNSSSGSVKIGRQSYD